MRRLSSKALIAEPGKEKSADSSKLIRPLASIGPGGQPFHNLSCRLPYLWHFRARPAKATVQNMKASHKIAQVRSISYPP